MLNSKINFDDFGLKIIPVSLNDVESAGFMAVPSGKYVLRDGVRYLKCYLRNDKQKSHYGYVWIRDVDFSKQDCGLWSIVAMPQGMVSVQSVLV